AVMAIRIRERRRDGNAAHRPVQRREVDLDTLDPRLAFLADAIGVEIVVLRPLNRPELEVAEVVPGRVDAARHVDRGRVRARLDPTGLLYLVQGVSAGP